MQESIQLVIDSLPFLLKGAGYTLQLSIGGMFFGLLLGFILALMRLSPIWPVRWMARFYISIFRGTPLIAQLFMIYYGLPQFGIELESHSVSNDWSVAEHCRLCRRNAARRHFFY